MKLVIIIAIAFVFLFSSASIYAQSQYDIPAWFKGVAGFWAEDKISDDEFGEGLSFLIDNDIIEVPKIQELENEIIQLKIENSELRAKLNLPQPVPEPILPTSISVQTDSSNYDEGDIVVISGAVDTIIGSTPITFHLFLEESLVDIAQITVAQDGTFSHTIIAEGPLWKEPGDYVIRILYGEGNIAETEFSYSPKSDIPETLGVFEVAAGNITFDVEYAIKGGSIADIRADYDNFALKVNIKSDDEGVVTLELPRKLIDAQKQDGKDDTFIVLIDGIEVAYQESEFDFVSRLITINFEERDNEIKIIGTKIIGIDSDPPPTPNISIANPRYVDTFGNQLNHVSVDQQIQIAIDVTNHSFFKQPFAFYMKIKGTLYEDWITGALSANQSFSPALSWIPTESGIYTVELSVFENIQNKSKLTDSVTIQITVN